MAAEGLPTSVFVDAMLEQSMAAAAEIGERQTLRLALARHPIEVTIVGSAFADRILPALRHAAHNDGASAALDVVVWDRVASTVLPPKFPWPVDDILPSGVVRAECTDGVWVHYDRWVRLLSILDAQRSLAIVHAADSSTLPRWMDRSPLRPILTRWCARQGDAVLHASSVIENGRAVVLAGPSGSGKSTTLMRCLAAGMQTTGDDACIVRIGSSVSAHPMFGLAKLERDVAGVTDGHRFPRLSDDDGRAVFDLGTALAGSAEVQVIAITEIVESPTTTWRSITAAEALRGLVDGSVEEGAGVSLRATRELVATVPCVRLTLGSDEHGVVAAVRGLLG